MALWELLPEGAPRIWGELASKSDKGRVQVANIAYEQNSRPSAARVVELFYASLENPVLDMPAGYSVLPIEPDKLSELERLATVMVEQFCKSSKSCVRQISAPAISKPQFDEAVLDTFVCRFVTADDAIKFYALYCQSNLRISTKVSRSSSGGLSFSSDDFVKSANFVRELQNAIPTTVASTNPVSEHVSFFTFLDALNIPLTETEIKYSEASQAVVIAGLAHYPRHTPVVRLDFLINEKPDFCAAPSIFSSEGGEAFCAIDLPDGFGRTRKLGNADEGILEFLVARGEPMPVTDATFLGLVSKVPSVNHNQICNILERAIGS